MVMNYNAQQRILGDPSERSGPSVGSLVASILTDSEQCWKNANFSLTSCSFREADFLML